jgi:uncharacterized protein YndB with AHSA1/START domain
MDANGGEWTLNKGRTLVSIRGCSRRLWLRLCRASNFCLKFVLACGQNENSHRECPVWRSSLVVEVKISDSKTMSTTKTDPIATVSDRDLIITRVFNAPREKVFKAWTDPELLKQWFAPLPYTTPIAELDVRPGGANLIVMRDPQGNDFPNRGVYLEVVENKRLVFTNAYTRAWEPSDKPFMTVIVTFEDERGKTKYTALVRHWTVADREMHEKMGFHQGWGQCADQLEALVNVGG